MVRVAGIMAGVSDRAVDRRALVNERPGCAGVVRGESVSAGSAKDDPRGFVAVLVYQHAREARPRLVVEARIPRAVCTHANYWAGRPSWRGRVANDGAARVAFFRAVPILENKVV